VSALRRPLMMVAACALQGCVVSTVVGTAADVGVAVIKVPIKAGKAVYDAATDDKEKNSQDDNAANDKNSASESTPPANSARHP